MVIADIAPGAIISTTRRRDGQDNGVGLFLRQLIGKDGEFLECGHGGILLRL